MRMEEAGCKTDSKASGVISNRNQCPDSCQTANPQNIRSLPGRLYKWCASLEDLH